MAIFVPVDEPVHLTRPVAACGSILLAEMVAVLVVLEHMETAKGSVQEPPDFQR